MAAMGALLLILAAIAVSEGWYYQWSGHRMFDDVHVSGQPVFAAGRQTRQRSEPGRRAGSYSQGFRFLASICL